jgi:CubicO group peptidase (beta-lactamase class C family)
MKKKISLILAMFCSQITFSQTTASYNSVIEKIKSTYNSKDYKGFYNLLSADFKVQQSEKDIELFLKDNVNAYYGSILLITFLKDDKVGFKHYKTSCEKGILEMLVACNQNNEVVGFTFLPYEEKDINDKKLYLSDNKKQSKLDLKVDSIVGEFMSNPINAGLSIGIIDNGQAYYYNYGETKKESKQLPSNNTIYEIGSVSKTFTGLLLANAIIDEKVNLDDDIRIFLPSQCSKLEYKGNSIKIKHLVTHTSRIPRVPKNLDKQPNFDELNPYKNYDKKMVYEYLSKLKLDTLPGVKMDYSNTGMALLGIILENVYKQSYKELLKKYITSSYEMKSTFVNVPTNYLEKFAIGYNDKGKETSHWDLGDQVGAGGIKSTIEDMTLYLKENIIESSKVIQNAHQVQFENGKEKVGFSWFIQLTKAGNTLVWHNGGTYGFTSFCGFVKEKKCGVVVLANSGTGVDGIARDILKHLQTTN